MHIPSISKTTFNFFENSFLKRSDTSVNKIVAVALLIILSIGAIYFWYTKPNKQPQTLDKQQATPIDSPVQTPSKSEISFPTADIEDTEDQNFKTPDNSDNTDDHDSPVRSTQKEENNFPSSGEIIVDDLTLDQLDSIVIDDACKQSLGQCFHIVLFYKNKLENINKVLIHDQILPLLPLKKTYKGYISEGHFSS